MTYRGAIQPTKKSCLARYRYRWHNRRRRQRLVLLCAKVWLGTEHATTDPCICLVPGVLTDLSNEATLCQHRKQACSNSWPPEPPSPHPARVRTQA